MTAHDLPLFTLWLSGALSRLCLSCVKSALRAGHDVHLYSYGDVPNLPAGVTHRDARDVVPEDDIFRYDGVDQPGRIGSHAPFSDLFRYRGLSQGRGVWMDADMYFLRAVDLASPVLLAWEHPQGDLEPGARYRGHIGNGIIRLPADSALVGDLVHLTSPPYPEPPWLDRDLRSRVHAKLAGRPFFPGAVTYATVGPVALTYYAERNGMLGTVQDHRRFYPVSFRQMRRFAEPDATFRAGLSARTEALHLWSSAFSRAFADAPPAGSFAARVLEESLDG